MEQLHCLRLIQLITQKEAELPSKAITTIFFFLSGNAINQPKNPSFYYLISNKLCYYISIGFELHLPFRRHFFRLVLFIKNVISHHEVIHFCVHKTFVSIFRRTNNWLAPYIKACIYNNTVTCELFKFRNQFPVFVIGFAMNSLNSGRIIDMCYSRNI